MSEPIIKFKDRGLSIGVFEYKNQDGSLNLSCDLQRSFKKKDAEDWTRENIHCYEDDLLKIANICTRAYNAIMTKRSKPVTGEAQKPTAQQPASAKTTAPAATPEADDDIPF